MSKKNIMSFKAYFRKIHESKKGVKRSYAEYSVIISLKFSHLDAVCFIAFPLTQSTTYIKAEYN